MVDINKSKESIPVVLLGFNVIFILISIFYSTKTLSMIYLIINTLFCLTYVIIKKYGFMFEMLSTTSQMAKGLNKMMEGLTTSEDS